jgi:CrcB protein
MPVADARPGTISGAVPRDPAPAPHRSPPRFLACIVAGGLVGTLGRYELGLAWPARAGGFPTATFVVNTSGAFLLGLVLTMLTERPRTSPYARPFVGTGVLGGWTTYSTLVVEAATLGKGGHLVMAGAYLAATLAAGLAAVVLGISLGPLGFRRIAMDLTVDPLE